MTVFPWEVGSRFGAFTELQLVPIGVNLYMYLCMHFPHMYIGTASKSWSLSSFSFYFLFQFNILPIFSTNDWLQTLRPLKSLNDILLPTNLFILFHSLNLNITESGKSLKSSCIMMHLKFELCSQSSFYQRLFLYFSLRTSAAVMLQIFLNNYVTIRVWTQLPTYFLTNIMLNINCCFLFFKNNSKVGRS
jgi:hypothetical protein